jgi:hypothetical protein
MLPRYIASGRRPITLLITSIDATFTAGPAISSTSAVPGDNPLSIRATAMGIEPVAQRYIGIARASTSSILNSELCAKTSKKELGTNTVMSPAMTSPIVNHFPMSCIISTKA